MHLLKRPLGSSCAGVRVRNGQEIRQGDLCFLVQRVKSPLTLPDRQTVFIWDTNPHTPRLYPWDLHSGRTRRATAL